MFGLVKFAFFVFVAAATGILSATVPFGGRTVGERLAEWWRTPAVQQGVADAAERVRRGVEAAARPPSETHDASARAEVDRLVAGRTPAHGRAAASRPK